MSYKTYEVRVYENGKTEWCLNGKLHRTEGPAVENGDYREYWVNGERHREDGPAVERGDYREYWVNGERHRTGGPAFERGDYREYWVNGKQLTEKEFNQRTQSCNGKVVEIEGKKYKLVEVK